ncbi:MAG: family 20 glycosylhydrolase, partial [Alistipes sp.]
MKNWITIGMLCMVMCSCGKVVKSDGEIAVIPRPEQITTGEGVFRLTPTTEVVLLFDDPQLPYAAEALNRLVQPAFGQSLPSARAEQPREGAINMARDTTLATDGYQLRITPQQIEITAGGAQGAFYAVQTLRQLLPIETFTAHDVQAIELPAVTIDDKPCLNYRGTMLDVGRHFFTKEEVKQFLEILAMHKINVFHWHLTDDQGWRIEIKKYPKLTEIGSKRIDGEGTEYGGFYTQE